MPNSLEVKIELLDGHVLIVPAEPDRTPQGVFTQALEVLTRGALEMHDDSRETWTLYAPSQVRSVTCQPKDTGLGKDADKGPGGLRMYETTV